MREMNQCAWMAHGVITCGSILLMIYESGEYGKGPSTAHTLKPLNARSVSTVSTGSAHAESVLKRLHVSADLTMNRAILRLHVVQNIALHNLI